MSKIIYYENGILHFDGENSNYDGKGIIYYRNGNKKYDGDFKNGIV
jgi:hypothetical protein